MANLPLKYLACAQRGKRQILSRSRVKDVRKNGTYLVQDPAGRRYKMIDPTEKAHESDATIYQWLNNTYWPLRGKWKTWLPYYGITGVREVNVSYPFGVTSYADRLKIHSSSSREQETKMTGFQSA